MLERRPTGNTRSPAGPTTTSNNALQMLGLQVHNLTEEMAQRYGYESDEGVIVTNVKSNSVAEEKGVRAGDLIVAVNRKPVRSVRELSKLSSDFEPGQIILFQIKRGRANHFVAMKVPK